MGKKVIVGLTSDEFVRRWKIEGGSLKQIEDFEKRKQSVLEFIKKEGVLSKTEIVEISDLFGPTLSKELIIDAIIVSEDTKKGVDIINQKRKELGLRPLKIFIAPLVRAEDGKLISSARIRNGEINREGRLYLNPLWLKKDLQLPGILRKEFQKPFGELLKDAKGLFRNTNNLVITVGDVTTKIFNEKSLGQNISVIDFKVAREKKFSNIKELGFAGSENIFHADNPAGYITSSLFRVLLEIFKSDIKSKIILQINGEEDLAVLPLILIAPLGTVIFYGQPNKGIVRIAVSEETKDKAYELVNKFEIFTRGY